MCNICVAGRIHAGSPVSGYHKTLINQCDDFNASIEINVVSLVDKHYISC